MMAVNLVIRGGKRQGSFALGALAGVTRAPRTSLPQANSSHGRINLFATTSLKARNHAISPDDLNFRAILKGGLKMPSVLQNEYTNGNDVGIARASHGRNGVANGVTNGVSNGGIAATYGNGHASASATDEDIDIEEFGAIVVGAGPAGLAVVGRLLDEGIKPIAWVDEKFEGGRLNARYREVPSNTKAKLFIAFARATSAFRDVVDSPKSKNDPVSPYNNLLSMDQETGCQIAAAADLCLQLTLGLARHPDVVLKFGKATNLTLNADTKIWEVLVTPKDPKRGSAEGKTNLVVLATGSKPLDPRLPQKYKHLAPLDLDIALTPSLLAHYLPTDKEEIIALIGASHSAILVLRNLFELATSTHPKLKVKWFSRHPLRYAEDMGDWIRRDNTGLKGETAIWARANLEGEGWENGKVKTVVDKIFTKPGAEEEGAYERELGDERVTRVCEAVGFERIRLPTMSLKKTGEDGETWTRDVAAVEGDGTTGQIVEITNNGKIGLAGLRGAGIAWPERVTDPEGNVESAVGMWKFMKYLTKVVPSWAAEAKVDEVKN